ncbi:MAG: hypothetical protein QOJ31_1813 [Gaiellales bacterium]|nr:hypothetical protein [Gaiellales bacterium]MDX6546117.1 hypothetical protein [Gaiellales bacterium]MDX6551129.1 hypothetical protein [Gaiellales bacterium]
MAEIPESDEPPQATAMPDVPPSDPPGQHSSPQGMVPGRERRRTAIERGFMRVVATGGIVGIATATGAILVSQDVAGWIVGLAVGSTSVVLAAILWSSRQL